MIHVQSSGREEVTGANVLVAIFAERESHAAYFLQEQDMTRYDAVNYISHGIAKRAGACRSRARCAASTSEAATAEDARQSRRRHDALDSLLRQPQREGQGGQDRSADRPRRRGRPHHPDPLPPRRRTTRSMSAIPASARPRSPKAWRQASSKATCPKCCRTRRSSRSTWARCSPARAIAAISRSG